ncbi:hypothetical protein PR001_g26918 [Phytophthora rubi]|uniref:SET domain-containing protein n=1 Tax=Phytophthora rubi TaxID=129364 RepID=A0A6A3HSH6_9STRA|nr:hypothetical protein PR001_g26918 [Phytophthora rubi]
MGADDLEPEVAGSPHQKKAKTSKDTMLVGSPLPWLRSGRSFTHALVVEAATIQVEALSAFQLVPLDPAHKTQSVVSSQRTVTEPSSPASPTPTHGTTEAFASPSPCSSQATTVGPWTPQHGRVPIDDPCFSGRAIPSWFSEVYESDGYDTDALRIISRIPRVSAPSTPSSRTGSPGFEMTGDTTLHSVRDEWVPDVWPADVKLLSGQHNPRNWKFTRVPTGARGGVGCGCAVRCTALTCLNARQSRFCNESNCAFAGGCGNALCESTALQICRNTRTGMWGLVAKRAIPAGEVIGQYFGHVQLFGPPCRTAPANDGYRMHLKTRSSGNKYMGIDALHEGDHLHLMNHHCNGAARFHEVQTGDVGGGAVNIVTSSTCRRFRRSDLIVDADSLERSVPSSRITFFFCSFF